MKIKALIAILVVWALSACAVPVTESPHSFATGKNYTEWKANSQVHYVMGLADAFTYLSAKNGHQLGLSNCFRKYGVHEVNLMNRLDSYIKTPQVFDRKYAGPPQEILPAAEVFDQLSSLYCKEERSSASSTIREKPHSFRNGKDYTIWNPNDQVHYAMGLADAFAYLAQRTGFLEGISRCYRENKVISARLMNQFKGYVESYKDYYKDYSGPNPQTLPAAEAFHQFNKLLCEGFLKDE